MGTERLKEEAAKAEEKKTGQKRKQEDEDESPSKKLVDQHHCGRSECIDNKVLTIVIDLSGD